MESFLLTIYGTLNALELQHIPDLTNTVSSGTHASTRVQRLREHAMARRISHIDWLFKLSQHDPAPLYPELELNHASLRWKTG